MAALSAALLLLDKDAIVKEITATGVFYYLAIGGATCLFATNSSGDTAHLSTSVALAFGISCYVTSTLFKGAHFNPATTVGSIVAGDTSLVQGIVNIVFQILAAILAGAFLEASIHDTADKTSFYANVIDDDQNKGNIIGGELLLSWILFYVYTRTKDHKNHALLYSLTFFICAIFLNNLDRVGLNPARYLGSLTCANFRGDDTSAISSNWWIFIIIPALGASLSALWDKYIQPFVPHNLIQKDDGADGN